MRALIRFTALTVAGAIVVGVVSAGKVRAGQTGTTPPDSGGVNLDGVFAPGTGNNDRRTNNGTPAAINAAISAVLETIDSRQSVISPTGELIPLTPTQAATITAALTTTGADARPAITALEQQLAAELGDLGINLSMVGVTPGNLTAAIASANALINSLSSEQLAAALESPTFVAIRAILAGCERYSHCEDVATVGRVVGIPVLRAP